MIQSPYVIVPFKYGIVGGILSNIMFFIIILFDGNPLVSNPLDFFVNSVILLVFIIFSIREFKKVYNADTLHFWQGINIGFLTTIIIALLTSTFIYIYLSYFDTDLLSVYKEIMNAQLTTNKEGFIEQFGQEIYDKTVSDNQHVSPSDLAWDEFIKKKLMIGFFITTIISVVLRQTPPTQKTN